MTCFSQLPSDYGLQRFIIKIRINEVNFLLMNRDQNISSDKRGIRINEVRINEVDYVIYVMLPMKKMQAE